MVNACIFRQATLSAGRSIDHSRRMPEWLMRAAFVEQRFRREGLATIPALQITIG